MYLNDLADVLRRAGLNVIEEPGWKGRNHGALTSVNSIICHWTAGANTGEYPSLGVVRDGRAGLAGPLAQLGLGRSGAWRVIGNGVAWHAGAVSNPSFDNFHAIGIEAEYTPSQGAWPAVQVESYARGVAALMRRFNVVLSNVRGHYEVAVPAGRKTDPNNLLGGMDNFRGRVKQYLDPGSPSPTPDPQPKKRIYTEDLTMRLEPGQRRSQTLTAPGAGHQLVINSAWVDIDVHKVEFIGSPGGSGVNYVGKQFRPDGENYQVDPGRPLILDVPADAYAVEVNYSIESEVHGASAGFRPTS